MRESIREVGKNVTFILEKYADTTTTTTSTSTLRVRQNEIILLSDWRGNIMWHGMGSK